MICNDNHEIYVQEIGKVINNSNSIHDVFLSLNNYFLSLRERNLLPEKMVEHCALRKLEQKVKDYCNTFDFLREGESRNSVTYFYYHCLCKLIEEEILENSLLVDACNKKLDEVLKEFDEIKRRQSSEKLTR
jgi:hypothetical protein